jgi:amino acid adenylation domain-containing protein
MPNIDQMNTLSPDDELTPEQRKLLELLLKKETSAASVLPIGRRDAAQPAPLSFSQQRLWMLDRLHASNPAYNLYTASRLTGALDVAALEHALNEVMRRHEVLRTQFSVVDDVPVQVVLAQCDLILEKVATKQEELAEQIRHRILHPFDLAQAPLLRFSLFQLAPGQHVLLLVIHHIAFDRWSEGILYRELGELYNAAVEGRQAELSEPLIQYGDYAVWQREWLQGERLTRPLQWWKQQLHDAPAVLELAGDIPRPALQSWRGHSVRLELDAALVEQMKEFSRRRGGTLFMVALSAWQTVLARYSGENDIVVGAPIAGRTRAELEGLIGFFVNTLALRTRVEPEQSFSELFAQVKETTLGAYSHQEVPFEKLVEELQPERSLAYTPVFQVMLVLQNTPEEAVRLAGLTTEAIELEGATAKFDLSLFLQEGQSGVLAAELVYNCELFDGPAMERLLGHYRRLLQSALQRPEARLEELEILSPAERQQLVQGWNRTEWSGAEPELLHQWFERQAERTPEARAVSGGDGELSYRGLTERSNQVAAWLRERGVGPETSVGLLVERGCGAIAAMLGVLKAGAAYVPLEASWPEQRLEFFLRDSGARVVISQKLYGEKLAQYAGTVLWLDQPEGQQQLDSCSSAHQPSPARAGNLAYLIYTSGSTGVPKGVAITHHSAAVFVGGMRQWFSPQDLKAVLGSTSFCFDLSIFEIFVTLSAGGELMMAQNALQTPDLPQRERLTLINTVPSAMAELIRMQAVPRSVRIVNLAGEPLPARLVEQLYQLGHVEQVWNLYGPSEDTTYSTGAVIERGSAAPPIGRSVPGTQSYILDQAMQPVPVGVTGMLYLGGEGLARGYLNRAELTVQSFVPDPFSGRAGARLYRTGDLARWRNDGQIQFLGRKDHQVKVRGFRIELGEIESALLRHPGVKEATVQVKGEAGDARLVGYVAGDKANLNIGELRARLQRSLPDYMVPQTWIILDQLPRNRNGKLDRAALPELTAQVLQDESAFEPPRTAVERVVAEIWEEVLQVRPVGTRSNFFELGGHSLRGMQVVARLRDVFGIDLSLRAIFEAPSVGKLATTVTDIFLGSDPDPEIVAMLSDLDELAQTQS